MENQENQNVNSGSGAEQSRPQSATQQVRYTQMLKKKAGDNIYLKGIIVVGLILAMLVPTPFILSLIQERRERKEKVVKEEGERFGGNQTIYGPFVKLPYTVVSDSSKVKTVKYLYISPKELTINGDLNPVSKHRGLFDILLYQAKLNIEADFDPSSFATLNPDGNYNWEKAEVVFSVSDSKGLEENLNFKIDGVNFPAEMDQSIDVGENIPSTDEYSSPQPKLVEQFKVPVSLQEKRKLKLFIPLSLKGMGALNFPPISKSTRIKINTSIQDLKFYGSASPIDTTKEKNRTLEWKVPSRGNSQIWANTWEYGKNKFGVEIIQPNNEYGKTNRVAKYSILFIGLTFVTFFFIEIINKLKIHPVQYVLVGLALSVFYLLLLSISEYVGFNISYFVSAFSTITLICWFIKGIVKKAKIMGVVFVVLTFLYSYIFVIIQLDELALLAGSIGLFIILALLMHFSRKIEWKTE